jgi:outer membrane protein
MKVFVTSILTGLLLLLTSSAYAQAPLKVGYINMNKAINESDEGRRSKQFLETQFEQSKKALDQKKFTIQAKEQELANSMMLSEAAKKVKKEEVEQLKLELTEEIKKEQTVFRQDEARHTQKIFQDLVSVVKTVAAAEKFDIVMEYNVSQTILYSKYTLTDITDKVILEYNKLQVIKQ